MPPRAWTRVGSATPPTQLRDRLASLGYAFDTDLFHRWEPDAQHNEAAWAARIDRILELLLAKP